MHRLLLWLWRVLPAPTGLRWLIERSLVASHQVGIHAVVFDDRGRILLAHHTYRTSFIWSLPGGWVEHGEDPADAVARELREETALTAVDIRLLGVRRSRARPSAMTLVYAARASGTFRPSAEVDAIEWVEVEQLPPELLSRYGEWIRGAVKA